MACQIGAHGKGQEICGGCVCGNGFVREWKRGIYLLTATGSTWTDFLMTSTVGNFGWLDTPMLFSVVIVIFVVLAFSPLYTRYIFVINPSTSSIV